MALLGVIMTVNLAIMLSAPTPKDNIQRDGQKQMDDKASIIQEYLTRPITEERRQAFFRVFESLGPEECVEVWLKEMEVRSVFNQALTRSSMMIRHLDTVPFLIRLVRSGTLRDSIWAMHLLCDMDRFVSLNDYPVHLDRGYITDESQAEYADQLHYGGIFNQFMITDGRRIGRAGRDIVMWAARQSNNKVLQLQAQVYSGALAENLKAKPIDELIRIWREEASNRGRNWMSFEGHVINNIEQILMESPNETIPMMTQILVNDKDRYVRNTAFNYLKEIDYSSYRLRCSEKGIVALQAMWDALSGMKLHPDVARKSAVQGIWCPFIINVIDEIVNPKDATLASYEWYIIARALEQWHGEKIVTDGKSHRVIAEFIKFHKYLAYADPGSRGWYFNNHGMRAEDMIMHPDFRKKIAKYHKMWDEFRQKGFIVPEQQLPKTLLELRQMCEVM